MAKAKGKIEVAKQPTPATCVVGSTRGTLFEDGPNPVYVLTDGRFAVFWGGVWKTAKTLAAIRKVYEVAKKALLVFVDYVSEREQFPTYNAIEFDNGYLTESNGKRHNFKWRNVYLYDQSIIDQLKKADEAIEAAEAEVRKLQEKRSAILARAKMVTTYNFEKLLNGGKENDS